MEGLRESEIVVDEVVKPDLLGKVDDPTVYRDLVAWKNPSKKRLAAERVMLCTCEWAYRAQKEGPLGADEIVDHLAVHHNLNRDTARQHYLPKVLQKLAKRGVPIG